MELFKDIRFLKPSFSAKTLKTLFAFLFATIAMNSNLVLLAIVHDKIPQNQMALPDLGFQLFPRTDWALDLSELIMVFEMLLMFIMISFQDRRGLLLRRLFVVVGSAYTLRGFFMIATIFPSADNWHGCAPQLNRTQSVSKGKRLVVPSRN